MSPRTVLAAVASIVVLTGAALAVRGDSPLDPIRSLVSDGGNGAVETFDGAPSAPQPWTPSDWDIQVHSRAPGTWQDLDSMQAKHGADCAGPPASHENHTYAGAVFICKDLLMTALKATDYGVIYLTPNRMLDWSQGSATLSVDVSTLRQSGRDWWDIWLSPYDANLALPLESWLPDLEGEPSQYIHIRMDGFGSGGPGFKVFVNGVQLTGPEWQGYEAWLTQDAARRDKFELTIDAGRIKFGMPGYNRYWVDAALPALTWNKAVVQFGHHSYNPTKDCGNANPPAPDGTCTPGTWHWDNVSISPDVPFSISRVGPRILTAPGSIVTGAGELRFAGICKVLIDGAVVNPRSTGTHPEHFSSYSVPVTSGTHAISFAPDSWYSSPCAAKDFSVWSLDSAPSSSPTAPAPATATPTQPVATATPMPTSTPSATSTSPGTCQLWADAANGDAILVAPDGLKWWWVPEGGTFADEAERILNVKPQYPSTREECGR